MALPPLENFDNSDDWSPVPPFALTAYWIAAALILWLAHTGEHWVFLLDSANLAFHEAGHPIFSILGESITVYGGTMGQLTFPLVAAWTFRRQHATASYSFTLLWLGENLFNIARYMADARAQILPLVGNGEHDWTEIFSRWHVLGGDTFIAGIVRLIGWGIILGAGAWLWYRSRESV
jgi:hypothetical protein